MPEQTIHMIDLIRRKRDGGELTPEEIQFLVAGAASQSISQAQLAAWLMAAWIRGLSRNELHALTTAMRFSGEVFDPTPLGKTAVDKHSTGGVGDKTSFLVAPIAAAAGLAVPMISGRALGHTGGTLDKLESIPGYRTLLSSEEFSAVLEKAGASIIGQTQNLVPADRVLYALRDHTGTVESPYLICASIMSKKLAAGLNALVLDVKTGSGAFLRNYADAEFLARLMVRTGEDAGIRIAALLTRMDEPLGRFSGNWLEVWESVELLQNKRHPISADLLELSLVLAGWMIYLGGKAGNAEAGRQRAEELIVSGAAYQVFEQMVAAHGGDTNLFRNPAAFHKPAGLRVLTASRGGYLAAVDCTQVGWAVQRLGAGREQVGGPVSAHAGLEMHVKLGARIQAGEPLCTLFTEEPHRLDQPEQMLRAALTIADEPPQIARMIRQVITSNDIRSAEP
jgi:pyrimidine-nucleoside phosphorylase